MQLLVEIPGGPTRCVDLRGHLSVASLRDVVERESGVPACEQRLLLNGREVRGGGDDVALRADGDEQFAVARVLLRVCGGKGGFGSLLRSLGAKFAQAKVDNNDACRDLSGRRLRHSRNEQRLAEAIAKRRQLEKEREIKRKERLERALEAPKTHFDQASFAEAHRAIEEEVDSAVEKGLQNAAQFDRTREKRKAESEVRAPAKRLKKWDDEEDVSDDSEGDGEGPSTAHGESSAPPAAPPVHETAAAAEVAPAAAHSSLASAPAETVTVPHTHAPSAVQPEVSATTESGSAAPAKESSATATTTDAHAAQSEGDAVDLEAYASADALEVLGLEGLKKALMARGLKCGGTMKERAQRLFSVKGVPADKIDPSLKAAPAKGKK